MFRGYRAWFSQSVRPDLRELWAAGGGGLSRWQDAEYLFSSDAAHPDTRRIHESLDYLEGRATVFHSHSLSAWASSGAGGRLELVLGHFILPPACLQEEIRRKIGHFIWEQAEDSPADEPSENLSEDPDGEGSEEEEEEDALLDVATESSEESESRAELQYRSLQEYPKSNMMIGYSRAGDMKKYVGELRDFTPGTSGSAVYWIQTKIHLRPGARSGTKRKL